RNRGMPLEALRYPITPAGLHYLLTHFDIAEIDPASWRLVVEGKVAKRLALSLEELQQMTHTTMPVTMECAGHGRAFVVRRPIGQPWTHDAVSTAQWTGVRVADVLHRADIAGNAVDVVFHGADFGIDRGVEDGYSRSLRVERALSGDPLLAW